MEESTIISTCPRTEGDGMESFDFPIASVVDLSGGRSITSAMQELTLLPTKSPPPIERIISLIPTIPAGIKPKQSSAAMENKKAKFVPYEPYKAAVKPIIPLKKKPIRKECTQTNLIAGITKLKTSDPNWKLTQDVVSLQDYNKVLKEKEELEAQLMIQSKVNAELKRLLVASVGEDMEARVHFLTEDKVKLADDIRQYVEKIACDFEQKEKLSIESDVWRSKFLASSVVIDELTKWKAVLCKHNNNLQLCLQGVLDEMNLVQHNQQQTYNRMKALNKAFHPLGSACPSNPDVNAHDVIETSESVLKLAASLSKRLLGTYTQVRDDEGTPEPFIPSKSSPAQLAAHEVLTSHPVGSCTMAELTNDINAQHVAALARRTLNKSFFTCCPHCTGQVHII